MTIQVSQIALDAVDPTAQGAWWSALLGWAAVPDPDGDIDVAPAPGDPGVPLIFVQVDDAAAGSQRLHLDLRSTDAAEQAALVARAGAAGARRVDIGQGEAPWVVLADPEGNLFCVLEPRAEYDDAGPIAAVVVQALDPGAAAGFWAAASGWELTRSEPEFASVRAPGGGGPALEFLRVEALPVGKNRLHLDLRPACGPPSGDGRRDAEVTRLVGLGARPLEVGQARAPRGRVSWAVLADPEGVAFCVLAD